ncbi:hypothetical protein [Mariniluteicoccus flavus]
MDAMPLPLGSYAGTCAFRLMPTDDLVRGESSAADGAQSGTLLLGSPDDDGSLTAAWVESWHQKPQLGQLTGRVTDDTVHLAMTYSGWGWTIELSPTDGGLRMRMDNVIPDGVDEAEPGPYVVMDAHWITTENLTDAQG